MRYSLIAAILLAFSAISQAMEVYSTAGSCNTSGGDLTGTCPAQTISAGAVTDSKLTNTFTSSKTFTAGLQSSTIAANGTLTITTSTVGGSVPNLYLTAGSNPLFGIGIATPAANLDVSGTAQFGSGATKSTFSATGALTLSTGSALTLGGTGGTIYSGSSVTASAFYGNGANVTGVVASGIPNTITSSQTFTAAVGLATRSGFVGVGMSTPSASLDVAGTEVLRQNQVTQGTMTVQGSAFSVGGSSFTVSGGSSTVGYQLSAGSLFSSGVTTVGGTATVVGNSFSVGGSSFTVAGGSATVAYQLTSTVDNVLGTQITGGTMTVVGNAFSVGGSSFVVTGSSVGIRTSAPAYALQNAGDTYTQGQEIVGGSATIKGTAFSVGTSTSFVVSAGSATIGAPASSYSAGTALDVWGNAQFGNGATKSTMTAGGNILVGSSIGIGTPSPATALHISTGVLTIDGTPSVNQPIKIYWGPGQPQSQVGWYDPSGNQKLTLTASVYDNGSYFGTVSSSAFSIVAGNARQVIVSSQGAVGMGSGAAMIGSPNGNNNALSARLHISSGVPALGVTTSLLVDGNAPTAFQVGPSSFVVLGSGNVGVGTITPGALFDVAGLSQFGSGATKSTVTAAGNFYVGGTTISAPGTLQLWANKFQINGSSFVVNSNGGVGIGLTNPVAPNVSVLDVARTDDGNGTPAFCLHNAAVPCQTNNTANRAEIEIKVPNTTGKVNFRAHVAGGSAGFLFDAINGDDSLYIPVALSGSRIALNGNSNFPNAANIFEVFSPTMVVSNAGFVGIGNSSPAQKLHMSSGTLLIDGNANPYLQLGSSIAVIGSTWASLGMGDFRFTAGSTMSVGGTINISTAPSAATAGTPSIFVAANGFVGIETASPASTFSVTGVILASGTTGSGLKLQDNVTQFSIGATSSTYGMGSPAAAQTTFGVCTTTLTIPTYGGRVLLIFSGSGITSGVSGGTIGLNVLQDGAFLAGYSSSVGMSAAQTATSINQPLAFSVSIAAPSPASHSYCLTSKASAGNFSFDSGDVQNIFSVREEP